MLASRSPDIYELNAYFKPTLNSTGTGWVIYKLMPYGQVLRMFSLRSDGVAVLYGKLRDRFPPTQPSYLTVYAACSAPPAPAATKRTSSAIMLCRVCALINERQVHY